MFLPRISIIIIIIDWLPRRLKTHSFPSPGNYRKYLQQQNSKLCNTFPPAFEGKGATLEGGQPWAKKFFSLFFFIYTPSLFRELPWETEASKITARSYWGCWRITYPRLSIGIEMNVRSNNRGWMRGWKRNQMTSQCSTKIWDVLRSVLGPDSIEETSILTDLSWVVRPEGRRNLSEL